MSIYHRWLLISSDMACIGSAILAVWAIPLFSREGLLPLLPSMLMIALAWGAITAVGCLAIWLRHEWSRSELRRWLTSLLQPRGPLSGNGDPAWATPRQM